MRAEGKIIMTWRLPADFEIRACRSFKSELATDTATDTATDASLSAAPTRIREYYASCVLFSKSLTVSQAK
jgi:hypothetical protein